jgi:PKD repeat protein
VITATPGHGRAPLHVQLSASLSHDDAAITDYTWEFPDQGDEPLHGFEIERSYDRSGEYAVRLTVLDSAGQSATSDIVVTVDNTAPIAGCRFSNDAPILRESVLFDASSSYDIDGDLVDFIWDFGDGETERGTRVTHAYEALGVYRVRLTVVDNAGAGGTVEHNMTVHEASSGGGCGGGSCG